MRQKNETVCDELAITEEGFAARSRKIAELFLQARLEGNQERARDLWATWKLLRSGEREWQWEQLAPKAVSA